MAEAYQEPLPVETLLRWVGMPNIAEELDDGELSLIGQKCKLGYEEDLDSMGDWLESVKDGMKLAKQIYEQKSDPWPGAANVKLPQISIATLHFAAGAYSELVKQGDVVQTHLPGLTPMAQAIRAENQEAAQEIAVEGIDNQQQAMQTAQMAAQLHARAKRVEKFMNWQLLEEIEEWEPEMDKLLHMLPVVGCVHKKTIYNPLLGRTETSVCDTKSVVINQGAKSLDRALRISELLPTMSANDVYERKAAGLFLDIDYQDCGEGEDTNEYEFVEQHRMLDLDDDGYEEPYIVTCEKNTWRVARIVARFEENDILLNQKMEVRRIEAIQHYSKYEFIPDFEGGYWSLGWSHIFGPLASASNSIVNRLLDSGTLANTQGGFMSQHVKLQEGGVIRSKMGEWKRVKAPGMKLADAFFAMPVREPSQVLFALLGLLVDMGKELSSITDAAMGEAQPNTPATTVLAMIEQGQKVYSSIHKRVYRALRSELKKLYRLNHVYLDPAEYQRLLNQPADPRQDFAPDFDVMPTASPELSSKHQRRAQAEALRYAAYDPAGMPVAGVDPTAVARYMFGEIVDDVEQFFPAPTPEDEERQKVKMMADDIMMTEQVKQAQAATKKLETEIQKNRAEVIETAAATAQKEADAEKKVAEAEDIRA